MADNQKVQLILPSPGRDAAPTLPDLPLDDVEGQQHFALSTRATAAETARSELRGDLQDAAATKTVAN
jgi:hypothetical protein